MVTLSITGPATCDTTKSCGPFILSADQSFVITGAKFQFIDINGDAALFDVPLPSGQDIHSDPLMITVDSFLSSKTTCPFGVSPCSLSCSGWEIGFPPINVAPPVGGGKQITITALVCNLGTVPPFVPSFTFTLTNNLISLTFPTSCFADQLCTFKISANSDLLVSSGTLFFFKKGGNPALAVALNLPSFNPPINIKTSPLTPAAIFDNLDPTGLVTPACGGSQVVSSQIFLNTNIGTIAIFNGPDFTLNTENCTQVQMHNISTTQDVIGPCVGVKGSVGIEGVLDTVGLLGLLQTFENQPVHIGLIDNATGVFYEYALTHTSVTTGLSPGGRFGASFVIDNRVDVVALVPPNGTRSMQLAALYEGDATHSQTMATKQITVQGENVTTPCFSGTLIAQKIFNTLPPDVTEVHQLITVFTTSIIPANLESQAQALLDKTATAITNSGATPLDVFVYHGPDVPLLTIFGLTIGTVPTLIVLAHAFGSPVAALVIVLAIVALLVVLGIIVYFISQQWADIAKSAFQFCQQNPQLCTSAITTVQILGVAAVVGAAALGIFLYTQRRGISRAIGRVT